MFAAWMLLKRHRHPNYDPSESSSDTDHLLSRSNTHTNDRKKSRFHDLVDADTVDLFADEYTEEEQSDSDTEDKAKKRKTGRMKLVWTLYYWLI
jgi:AAT family amino acid transporter